MTAPLKIGDKVQHNKYGIGEIKFLSPAGEFAFPRGVIQVGHKEIWVKVDDLTRVEEEKDGKTV